jgi:hypothetical protein
MLAVFSILQGLTAINVKLNLPNRRGAMVCLISINVYENHLSSIWSFSHAAGDSSSANPSLHHLVLQQLDITDL